jgi:uncharacterized membrane protein
LIANHFSVTDLAGIKEAVRKAELETSGEIRVVVHSHCDPDLQSVEDLTARVYRQALREFGRHGMSNTRERTGVLVLLVMEERRFQILADTAINEKFSQDEWDALAAEAGHHFRERRFAHGVCFLVGEIGNKLAEFFPRRPDDVNELPDDVDMGGGA